MFGVIGKVSRNIFANASIVGVNLCMNRKFVDGAPIPANHCVAVPLSKSPPLAA